jgi:predicted acetyltransferase
MINGHGVKYGAHAEIYCQGLKELMAALELRKASLDENLQVLHEMHNEIPAQETGFTNPAFELDADQFEAYVKGLLAESRGAGLSEGRVPMTTYWLFEDGLPVGISRFNHMLTPDLLREGGHVSYAIRPTARGRGLGTRILELTLEKVKNFVSGRVLLTCDTDNDRSKKVIEHNGGVSEVSADQGILRYWIII